LNSSDLAKATRDGRQNEENGRGSFGTPAVGQKGQENPQGHDEPEESSGGEWMQGPGGSEGESGTHETEGHERENKLSGFHLLRSS
jgi:hypothetical protein